MKLVFDIETDGLYDKCTKIHCIVTMDADSEEVRKFHGSTLVDGVKFLNSASSLVGHNIISFDLRAIKKIYPWFTYDLDNVHDTLILSQLFYPDIGKHSLAAWGERMGHAKVEHTDWTTFSMEMLHRCSTDVEITQALYRKLQLQLESYDWSRSIRIEQHFSHILAEQESYGWALNRRKAIEHCLTLRRVRRRLNRLIRRSIPYTIASDGEFKNVLKKDGSPKAAVNNWYNSLDVRAFRLYDIVGDFTRIRYRPLNVSSNTQCNQVLLNLGWIPDEYNYSKTDPEKVTSPKITYTSLRGIPVGEKIAKYKLFSHRFRQLFGWLKRMNKVDGTIGAGGISCGTNTGRVRHTSVVNVPRVGSFFGKEMREIFTVRPGCRLVGVDFTALENRVIGHYTSVIDGGVYAKRLEVEDPHDNTVELAKQCGLQITRTQAKTVNYALSYGAQPPKLQDSLGCHIGTARNLWNAWWEDRAALKVLKGQLESAITARGQMDKNNLKRGAYIKGLDGRKVYVRSRHSLLNALIQSAGAVLNKVATIYLYRQIGARGIHAHLVGNFHDEIQAEVEKDSVEMYKQLAVESIEKSGQVFDLRISMVGDVKVGNNWKETH